MKTVYLVIGNRDKRSWVVAAFKWPEQASHCAKLLDVEAMREQGYSYSVLSIPLYIGYEMANEIAKAQALNLGFMVEETND